MVSLVPVYYPSFADDAVLIFGAIKRFLMVLPSEGNLTCHFITDIPEAPLSPLPIGAIFPTIFWYQKEGI